MRVRIVAALFLQAFRAELYGSCWSRLPDARAWESIWLTKNEYHLLLYIAALSYQLRTAMLNVRYDWIPNDYGNGVLTLRNPDSIEVQVQKAVGNGLLSLLGRSQLFCELAQGQGLEVHQRALVNMNGNFGMRTPTITYCHCERPTIGVGQDNEFREDEELHWLRQDFVVELVPDRPGVAFSKELAPQLSDMIKGYLDAGVLYFMTVEVVRRGEHDVSLTCWLYRNQVGKIIRVPVDGNKNHPGLNLFGIVPAEFLREADVTDRQDNRAKLEFINDGIGEDAFPDPVDQQLEEVSMECAELGVTVFQYKKT